MKRHDFKVIPRYCKLYIVRMGLTKVVITDPRHCFDVEERKRDVCSHYLRNVVLFAHCNRSHIEHPIITAVACNIH